MFELCEDHPKVVVAFIAVFLLITVVSGCSPSDRHLTSPDPPIKVLLPAISPTPDSAEEMAPRLLEVEQFSLTEKTLRLDYRVSNVFSHDIWVCVNTNHLEAQDSRFSMEAEICEGALQIRRRGNLEQTALVNAFKICAVYCRLAPGESRSDVVLLPLPVRSYTPLRGMGRIPVNPVVLKQVALEVGYFGEALRDLISDEDGSGPIRGNACFRDPNTVFISYIEPNRWDNLHLEQSARVTVSDVSVPGKIPRVPGGAHP